MSQITLYRKHRPQNFKDVLGQDHVLNVLISSIEKSSISHAYLFSGPKGTGKTSVARILAKELGTNAEDLFEIDGASNRGIDDVRVLRDAVFIQPFNSTYKVYIIDEVHMLTGPAFNALLKTLEEPPEHVIFILATTELEKVPDTIISRCQNFSFRKPTEEILKKMAISIAKKEGYELSDDGGNLIAFLGDGSFRDAQGMLQKVIAVTKDKNISRQDIEKITGAPNRKLIDNFTLALLDKDSSKGISAIDEAVKNNADMKIYARLTMQNIRNAMLLFYTKDIDEDLVSELGKDNFDFVKSLANHKNAMNLLNILENLIDAYEGMRFAYKSEVPLELALLKTASMGDV